MKQKYNLIVFLLVLVTLIFSGCSSNNDSVNSNNDVSKIPSENVPVNADDKNTLKNTNKEKVVTTIDKNTSDSSSLFPNANLLISCISGGVIEDKKASTAQGSSRSLTTIVGFENFKGNEYCKLNTIFYINGVQNDIIINTYTTSDNKDVWTVTNFSGQNQEDHVVKP